MQEGQWSDMGMLIQTMMLLARERGLHTCPQEAWAIWAPTVKEYLGIPDSHIFFCGLALGYADPDASVNSLESPRAPMDEVVTYLGFKRCLQQAYFGFWSLWRLALSAMESAGHCMRAKIKSGFGDARLCAAFFAYGLFGHRQSRQRRCAAGTAP